MIDYYIYKKCIYYSYWVSLAVDIKKKKFIWEKSSFNYIFNNITNNKMLVHHGASKKNF